MTVNPTDELNSAQLALALSYGTDLPKPAKPKIDPPGFFVGSCYRMVFSPDGERLLVSTANGCFLWDVASRRKITKLNAISNPVHFCFSADSSELLMRNESLQFARFRLDHGELIGKFTAKHKFRMDGCPCFGPDQKTVLQMSYDGLFLQLDAFSGEVLFSQQLARKTYAAGVYWLSEQGELVVSQKGVSNWLNKPTRSTLWRWRWPLNENAPVRVGGRWRGLSLWHNSTMNQLILHSKIGNHSSGWRIDVLELPSMERVRQIDCEGGIISIPRLSFDGQWWAVSTNRHVQVGDDQGSLHLPVLAASADFHPHQDLIAIPGPAGFVAQTSKLASMVEPLSLYADEGELSQRGYSRMTTYPNSALPPRFVIYESESGWVFEGEARAPQRRYVPLKQITRLDQDAPLAQVSGVLSALSVSNLDDSETRGEARHPLNSIFTCPISDSRACVAVSFASDAIELRPAKPKHSDQFEYAYYPVAAIPPDSNMEQVWYAAKRMLNHFRARKS